MQLDAPTLFVMMIVVTVAVALLLIWAWLQNRRVEALAWWGVAYLLAAAGSALIPPRGLIPDWLSIDLANALVFGGYALAWMGARVFNGRTVRPIFFLGLLVWLAACQFEAFHSSLAARATLGSLLIGGYSLLTAWEFWRAEEPLASRSAAVFCLSVHGLVFFSRLPAMMLSPASEGTQPLSGYWFAFVAFEGIVFSIAAAFLLLAMAKEREELRHKTASLTDPLTGAFNRRAFINQAERLMGRVRRDDGTIALLLFDLDHFKKINDTYGHQTGDEVLRLFCQTASAHLRPNDVFGRLGGEEFAAMLPEADMAHARKVADRISAAFAAATQDLARSGLQATVSAGIAGLQPHHVSIADLLTAADQGLYKAKRMGRNRVEHELAPRFVPAPIFSPPMAEETV